MAETSAPAASAMESYEEELARTQRDALRVGFRLAAPLLVAFSVLDWVVVSEHWAELGVQRLVCGGILLSMAALLARRQVGETLAGLVGLAAVAAPISAGVLWSGGTASPYLDAMLIPMSAVAILVPLRPAQLALFLAEIVAIALVPLVLWSERGAWIALAAPASYYAATSLLAVSGAVLHDRLRRREHLARREMLRQVGLVTLGQMSGSLAHELANPLAVVTVQLERLLSKAQQAGSPTQMLETAVRAALRMRDILQAMRRGARLGDGARKQVDLARECELALNLVDPALRREVQVEQDFAPLPPVAAEPTLLGQLLVNLLVNACHALQGREGARVLLRLRAEGERALVEVEDNGPGVPQPLRERIFEPFFSTKGEEGNGLGLWICAEIARAHGGTLELLEAPSGGALFRFALPIRSQTETTPTPHAA